MERTKGFGKEMPGKKSAYVNEPRYLIAGAEQPPLQLYLQTGDERRLAAYQYNQQPGWHLTFAILRHWNRHLE